MDQIGESLSTQSELRSAMDWEPASLASVWVSRDRGVDWHQVTSIDLVPGWPPMAEVIPFGEDQEAELAKFTSNY